MDYHRIYGQLIDRAKTRLAPEGYVEHHHIVPRCMGGTDDSSNIAVLTPEEHFMAHLLLVKMWPNERNLILAVRKMMQGRKGRLKTKHRRLYGWVKKRHSEYMKERMTGSRNPNWGKQLSEETKKKISNSLIGSRNPNYGKKMSESQKKKISNGKMGIPNSCKGKSLSEDTKKKISETMKGRTSRPCSEMSKKKISEAMKSFHASRKNASLVY